jgi:uncharacterized membrane protein
MNETRFSAADLEPSDDDLRAARRSLVERTAATLAVLAAGVWVGGMVALGACAAPFVFRLTPAPFSGDAMGSAFARFDQIALGAAVVLLGAEVARTWAAGGRGRTAPARVRRFTAIVMAACAAYGGLVLTPHINALHRAGAQRGQGPQGEELDRVHKTAETVGKAETGLGAILVALHVFTLAARRPDDDDDYATPGAPGAGTPSVPPDA